MSHERPQEQVALMVTTSLGSPSYNAVGEEASELKVPTDSSSSSSSSSSSTSSEPSAPIVYASNTLRNRRNRKDDKQMLLPYKAESTKERYYSKALQIFEVTAGVGFTATQLVLNVGWAFFGHKGFDPLSTPKESNFTRNTLCGSDIPTNTTGPHGKCQLVLGSEVNGVTLIDNHNVGLTLIYHIFDMASYGSAPGRNYYSLFPALLGVTYLGTTAVKYYRNGKWEEFTTREGWIKWLKSYHLRAVLVFVNFIIPLPIYSAAVDAKKQILNYFGCDNLGANSLDAPSACQDKFVALTNSSVAGCHVPATDNGKVAPGYASCLTKELWYYGEQSSRALDFLFSALKKNVTTSIVTLTSIGLAGAVGYLLYGCCTSRNKAEVTEINEHSEEESTSYENAPATSITFRNIYPANQTNAEELKKELDQTKASLAEKQRDLASLTKGKGDADQKNSELQSEVERLRKELEDLQLQGETDTEAKSQEPLMTGFTFVGAQVKLGQAKGLASSLTKSLKENKDDRLKDDRLKDLGKDMKASLDTAERTINQSYRNVIPKDGSVDSVGIGSFGLFVNTTYVPVGQKGARPALKYPTGSQKQLAAARAAIESSTFSSSSSSSSSSFFSSSSAATSSSSSDSSSTRPAVSVAVRAATINGDI